MMTWVDGQLTVVNVNDGLGQDDGKGEGGLYLLKTNHV